MTDEDKALLALKKAETTYQDQEKKQAEEAKRILEQQDRELTEE